jgi:hypothetical protein
VTLDEFKFYIKVKLCTGLHREIRGVKKVKGKQRM